MIPPVPHFPITNYFSVQAVDGVPSFFVNSPGVNLVSQQFLVDTPFGNHLISTSLITDMNSPRTYSVTNPPAKDKKGRVIHWELT